MREIIPLDAHRMQKFDPEDMWLRRQALQIAVQLPENSDQALRVLRHAETLVRSFIGGCGPIPA